MRIHSPRSKITSFFFSFRYYYYYHATNNNNRKKIPKFFFFCYFLIEVYSNAKSVAAGKAMHLMHSCMLNTYYYYYYYVLIEMMPSPKGAYTLTAKYKL